MEDVEFVEKYAILFMGVDENPVPSIIHLQKELFILSKIKPLVQEKFNFESHYMGPYSQILSGIVEDPVYVTNAFGFQEKKVFLNKEGKEEFKKLVKEYSNKEEFQNLILSLKFIRKLYEKLTNDEILFLIYDTYPEYLERSKISDKLLNNSYKARRIIEGLFSKNLISLDRYNELNEKYL